jgi:4-aminobutyrate aminotransferase/(S)-3-amino-2-methylpropionate transaminase
MAGSGRDNRGESARYAALLPRALGSGEKAFASSARGAVITDIEGNRFIDLAAGIGTLNTGHCPPAVVEALSAQVESLLHTCFQVFPYAGYLDVVEKLVDLFPGDGATKGILFNSGAEAVENAVKIARNATGRSAVLCFEGAFHGRTLLTLSLTSKTSTYKRGFGPFCSDVFRIPFPYCYRCPVGLERSTCAVDCTGLLDRAIEGHVDAQSLAAVVIEPVLGEGGFVPCPAEFMQAVRAFCDRTGAVMIVDEVQTGFGRTGTTFAIEQASVSPDLLVLAKSLAAGLPLSAVVGRAELLDAVQPGGLGGTYGGNPVACAAALASMKAMEEQALSVRARALGQRIDARLQKWAAVHPERFGDVRGVGAMRAVELVHPGGREPDTERAKAWTAACRRQGVVVLTAGVLGNVVRLLPPLIIEDTLMDDALDKMEKALTEVMS